METVNVKKVFYFLFKVNLSLCAIWFVISRIDKERTMQVFSGINWILMIPAFILFVASKFVSAVRLNHFFRNIGLYLSDNDNLKLYMLGMFYNMFLPGGIGGDGYKVWILSRNSGHAVRYLASAVLLDRVNGMVAILLITAGLIPFIPIPVLYRVLAPFLIPVCYLFYSLVVLYFFPKFRERVGHTTLLSVLVQVLQVSSVLFISSAIGISGNLVYLVIIFLASSVIAVLPLSIGGIGLRELVFLFGSNMFFIDINQAVSVSMLFFLITALSSLPGVYFVLIKPLKELNPVV